ncbi:Phage regulatory protein Rha [Pseudoalteromonas sp. THAF3]|uniref:Rha family transcriptional regulator n=1 Tax=Pseudoalteromonas sp. THAF3 TaxID=2587843 RepID=UPI0012686B1F|nr:Rha family transcriptional regulator [Pseudoalteromonas sp. THAF3]QFU04565.1 Phage regulatory protein Rha [Pseudoalteromonas sp. THAF3]
MNLKHTMTSREIAELTGKRHANVVRDTEAMFSQLKIEAADYLDTYADAQGKTRKQYRLDRDLTMTLVTKYDTARRYAVVRRWRELEEQEAGRELSEAELIEKMVDLAKKYREEAHDKTSRMLLPKNIAANLSDRRKGRVIHPADVNEALIALGFMTRSTDYVDGKKRYFYDLTDRGREFGRVGSATKTNRSLEWRAGVLPILEEYFDAQA